MQLPMNRVRQIAQKDDEYRLIDKKALVLIAKATEMFMQDLGGVCGQIAKAQKRKTLQVNDIMSAACNIDKFHFIKGMFKLIGTTIIESKLPSLNPKKQQEIDTIKEA